MIESRPNIEPVGRFLSLKKALSVFLCSPIVDRAISLLFLNRIPHRGSRIEIPKEAKGLASMLFWGIYESAEIRFVRQYLEISDDVVELGSSIGGVSCEIAKLLSPNQKLICVEANPNLLEILERNLRKNAPNRKVKCINAAISSDSDKISKFILDESILGSHLIKTSEDTEGGVEVNTLTLSDLLKRENVNEYSLVCDIEGAEVQIVNSDASAFRKCKTLIIELHVTEFAWKSYTPDSLIDLIQFRTKLRLVARYGCVCVFKNYAFCDLG